MKAEKSGDWETSSRATSGPARELAEGSTTTRRGQPERARVPNVLDDGVDGRRHSLFCGESRRGRIKSRSSKTKAKLVQVHLDGVKAPVADDNEVVDENAPLRFAA